MADDSKTEVAVLGGGCFWCLDAAFSRIQGVESVVAGYSGGNVSNPTYEQVSSGSTGHAEVVKITYDPKIISYEDLLHIFFVIHDPTTLNRQGSDIGPQYRSIIFYLNEKQDKISENVIGELDKEQIYNDPIVTESVPLEKFYPAEDYHQKYFEKNPDQAYCQIIIAPKLSKLREKYGKLFK